jgi:hypothetical protein
MKETLSEAHIDFKIPKLGGIEPESERRAIL